MSDTDSQLGSPYGASRQICDGDSRLAPTRKRTGSARVGHRLAQPHLRVHQRSSSLRAVLISPRPFHDCTHNLSQFHPIFRLSAHVHTRPLLLAPRRPATKAVRDFDSLSVVMLVAVTTASICIHLYSISYMGEEEN